MAKPTSNLGNFKGTIDGITYYTLNGEWVCRKTAPPAKEQIQNDPHFKAVRKNNKELGGASSYAKAIRIGLLPDLEDFKDHSFNNRLTSRCLKICKAGRGPKGERNVNACNAPNQLVGLDLNTQNSLSDRLRFQPKLIQNPTSVLISLSGLKKQHLKIPNSASHFQLLMIRNNVSPYTYNKKQQKYTSDTPPEELPNLVMPTPPIPLDKIPTPLEFNIPFYNEHLYTWAYLEDPYPIFTMKDVAKKTAHTIWLGIRFGLKINDELEAFATHNAMQCIAVY
ncbi:hypothetical protein ACFSYG_12955 [Leeuwenhoekiella polynyae]|uniref:Uncharacterized protein n=1 Tax=Leeuwenhoekiella polynyae TaxID=1550906 RepID=A0A4Q0NNZ0_9FLAO|nr:hypothetical protein [Leeuwenhoekiella polynyae]RXG11871.1 hypothetical protein DSM02_3973 [Leeuwenhoekiella polynyae]